MDQRAVELIQQFIQQNISRPMRVDELAAVVGMSSSCFARLFKLATDRTPQQYVMRQRICVAAELMRTEEGLPLAQIAVRCGFTDQPHLSRTFKRIMGKTPAQYRREIPVED